MGQEKNKIVSIGVQYNEQKQVIGIYKNVNVNPATYNALKNEYKDYLENQFKEKQELVNAISLLEKKVDDLKQEIKLLKGEE